MHASFNLIRLKQQVGRENRSARLVRWLALEMLRAVLGEHRRAGIAAQRYGELRRQGIGRADVPRRIFAEVYS
jgi:hypothetical protein